MQLRFVKRIKIRDTYFLQLIRTISLSLKQFSNILQTAHRQQKTKHFPSHNIQFRTKTIIYQKKNNMYISTSTHRKIYITINRSIWKMGERYTGDLFEGPPEKQPRPARLTTWRNNKFNSYMRFLAKNC